MNNKILLLLCIITILCNSCSSIKLKNGVANFNKNTAIKSVKLIAENEKLIHNGKKIGDFVLKEEWKNGWDNLKTKMENFAKLNGGNLIEIKTFGWGKKGHGFYADGTLFYVDNIDSVKSKVKENCAVFIIRDNLESLLGSAFTIDIKIDETEFKNLRKKTVAKKEFTNCNQNVNIAVNGKNYNIKLKGESRYFKVGKQTSGNSMGGGISVGIGSVALIEIENKELGKLMVYQNN
jgi:hypothetical protein